MDERHLAAAPPRAAAAGRPPPPSPLQPFRPNAAAPTLSTPSRGGRRARHNALNNAPPLHQPLLLLLTLRVQAGLARLVLRDLHGHVLLAALAERLLGLRDVHLFGGDCVMVIMCVVGVLMMREAGDSTAGTTRRRRTDACHAMPGRRAIAICQEAAGPLPTVSAACNQAAGTGGCGCIGCVHTQCSSAAAQRAAAFRCRRLLQQHARVFCGNAIRPSYCLLQRFCYPSFL